LLGIAPDEDDDGNAASQRPPQNNGSHAPARPAPPREPTADERKVADEIEAAFDEAETEQALKAMAAELKADIERLPIVLQDHVRAKFKLKRQVLQTFGDDPFQEAAE
jgi:predicted component of type VI protein secretion system